MSKFAKLFNFDDDNQLLVTFQAGENDRPEVRLRTSVDAVTIEMAPNWDDTDAGWDRAEDLFNSIDEDKAKGFRAHMESIVRNGGGE